MNEDRHRPLSGLRPPGAPLGLRRRVLDAARAARVEDLATGGASAPGPSLTDRLWENRLLRLSWAAVFVALIGVNLYLDRGTTRPEPADRVTNADRSSAGDRPAPAESRTLLAARGEVFDAVLGDPLERAGDRPSTHDPRRTP